MRFRVAMMIGVTLLDIAFCAAALRAETPDNSGFQSVKKDFEAGFAGDDAALDRAMKASEDLLAKDPKAARPMVWHGSGLMFKAGKLFGSGDMQGGTELFDKGIKEMNTAVSLEPENPSVLIPRGATFLQASLLMPDGDDSKALLKQGLADYLKAVDVLKPHFDECAPGLRGRLLFGIADADLRLGDTQDAAAYFQRASSEAKGTGYARNADAWLATKTLTREQEACTGCESVR